MPVLRWNTDKPHRCPDCHAVAVSIETPRSWRVYTCCRCATRFTRWPRLARLLPDAGIFCGEHRTVREGLLDETLSVIEDPGWRSKGLGWEDAYSAVRHLRNGTHPSQTPASVPAPKPPCTGFHWIGQPFYSCDNCGRPAWDHAGMHTFDGIVGPFDRDPGRTEPWKPGEADAIRAKWEPGWHQAAGCSDFRGAVLHGPNCPTPPAAVPPEGGQHA